MTNPVEPKPTECWGLYDASGKMRLIRTSKEGVHFAAREWYGEPLPPGYTIRPGTFVPQEVPRG